MTTEHLRFFLDDQRAMQLFSELAARIARAQVPTEVIQTLRLGQMTALSKPDGGVRGIVLGDEYALSTKAGCQCIAHALQGITELHPDATVTSIDGVSAYDLISRGAMLRGLTRVMGAELHSHLCGGSTDPHPSTCGKTRSELSTASHKVKEGSRVTR